MPGHSRKPYTKKKEASREAAKGAAKTAHKADGAYTARYTVPRSDTLLAFLLKKCKQSRNNVKALLSGGKVLVNGRTEKQFDFPLAKDDEIKIAKTAVSAPFSAERATRAQTKEKAGLTTLVRRCEINKTGNGGEESAKDFIKRFTKRNILFENGEFLVVDKPAGLLSVESDEERLSAYYLAQEYLRGKAAGERAYVLHRIDKETSGVLAFAKDVKIHSMLRMRWNELVLKREYYAVVSGVFNEKSGEIVLYLKEDKNHMVYAAARGEGKRAVTKYETLRGKRRFFVASRRDRKRQKKSDSRGDESGGAPRGGRRKIRVRRLAFKKIGVARLVALFKTPRNGRNYVLFLACSPRNVCNV